MKRLLPVIIVLLVLVFGGIIIGLTRDENKSNNSNQQNNTNKGIDALPTTGQSFVATINATVSDKTVSSTMEYDKTTTNVRYKTTLEGKSFETIYTKEFYYTCQSSKICYKFPNKGTNSSFDPKSFEYTSDDLADYRSTAVDMGEKSCSSGTCHAWKVSRDGHDTTIYIDNTTKQITQVEGSNTAGKYSVTYVYKDVNITPPANAQSLPQV